MDSPLAIKILKVVKTVLKNFLFLLLSSLLLTLSHPNYFNSGIGGLVFIALIPCFYVIKRVGVLESIVYGFIFGVLYYILLNYWLITFHPLAIVIVPVLRGIEYALIFLFLNIVNRSFKKARDVLFALSYTSALYLLEQGFLGYSYGNVAFTLYKYPLLIQSADIFGVWFIVFVIAYVNLKVLDVKKSRKGLLIALLLLFVMVIYGAFRINVKRNANGDAKTLNVLLIQHNDLDKSNTFEGYRLSFDDLKALTDEGLSEHSDVDLVVWSETAFIPPIGYHKRYNVDIRSTLLVDELISYSFNLGIPILLGNGDAEVTDETKGIGFDNAKYYNASILLDNGVIEGKYRKNHLVPFTEYFPYGNVFPRFYAFLLSKGFTFWDKGDEITLFDVRNEKGDSFKIYTPICFEDTFSALSRTGVKKGAEILINLTNDAWSGEKSAEYQHLSSAVYRSIENGVKTIRSTNSGASCAINEDGSIQNLLPLFEKSYGFYSVTVHEMERQTVYSVIGDYPIKVVAILVVVLVVLKNIFDCIHHLVYRRRRR